MKNEKNIYVINCNPIGFTLVGCNNYEYKEDDFKCTISVDKINVKVGDTIKIKVILKNVSGEDISVKMTYTDRSTLKDMILIGMLKSDKNYDFIVNSKGGLPKKDYFKNDEINSLNDYEVQALITFYTGKGYNQKVSIYSDVIKIIVEE